MGENKKNSLVPLNNNMSKKFFCTSITLAFLTFIYIVLNIQDNYYKYLFTLPLSYAVILLFSIRMFLKPYYSYGPLFYSAQIFIFIRYVLMPLSIVMLPETFVQGPDPTVYEMNVAFVLMTYEMLCGYIVINIATSKHARTLKDSQLNTSILKHKFIVMVIALLSLIVLIKFPNSIIPSQLFIINEGYSKAFFDSGFDGAIVIMSWIFKCLAFFILLSVIKKRDKNSNFFSNFLISAILLIALIGTFTSTSRWTLIFIGISGMVLIEKLYPKYKFTLRIWVFLTIIISVISISLFKFWWVISGSVNPIRDVIYTMATQLEAYFSGPRLVAQSINIQEVFSTISIGTFFNDFLGSVPYISNDINQLDRINIYFNLYNFKQVPNLIMPLVGIGYTYFGFVFAPIFTVACQWIVIKLDTLIQNEVNLEYVFIYTYLGLRLSMCMGLNTQSLFSSFFIPTLPLLLILKFNSKICLYNRRVIKQPDILISRVQ